MLVGTVAAVGVGGVPTQEEPFEVQSPAILYMRLVGRKRTPSKCQQHYHQLSRRRRLHLAAATVAGAAAAVGMRGVPSQVEPL